MIKDRPTLPQTSLGVKVTLDGGQAAELEVVTDAEELFPAKMRTGQCDKTPCLNYINTSFMPSLSYIATQFTEQQWNKVISPAICVTLNAASMVHNLAHALLYGPDNY